MSVSIAPKSEIRQTNAENIVRGFGEVPAVLNQHKPAWALPGNIITFCQKEAIAMAETLDSVIRRTIEGKIF